MTLRESLLLTLWLRVLGCSPREPGAKTNTLVSARSLHEGCTADEQCPTGARCLERIGLSVMTASQLWSCERPCNPDALDPGCPQETECVRRLEPTFPTPVCE